MTVEPELDVLIGKNRYKLFESSAQNENIANNKCSNKDKNERIHLIAKSVD